MNYPQENIQGQGATGMPQAPQLSPDEQRTMPRPRMLTIAIGVWALAGVLGLVGPVAIMTMADDAAAAGGSSIANVLRGVAAIFIVLNLAVIACAFTMLAGNGGRIALAIVGAIDLLFVVLNVGSAGDAFDYGGIPALWATMFILQLALMLGGFVVMWLGGIGQYYKSK